MQLLSLSACAWLSVCLPMQMNQLGRDSDAASIQLQKSVKLHRSYSRKRCRCLFYFACDESFDDWRESKREPFLA